MYFTIAATAALSSLDAFFIGMSLGAQKGFKPAHLFAVAAIILLMCVIASLTAAAFKNYVDFDASPFVGAAFLLLGLKSLLSKDSEKSRALAPAALAGLGFIMTVDAVVATAALTLGQARTFFIPLTVAGGHLLYLLAGSFVTRRIKIPSAAQKVLTSACLILVAALNFAGVL